MKKDMGVPGMLCLNGNALHLAFALEKFFFDCRNSRRPLEGGAWRTFSLPWLREHEPAMGTWLPATRQLTLRRTAMRQTMTLAQLRSKAGTCHLLPS